MQLQAVFMGQYKRNVSILLSSEMLAGKLINTLLLLLLLYFICFFHGFKGSMFSDAYYNWV